MIQQPLVLQKTRDAYRKQSILTASPIELIVMLYDGLGKNILLAQKAIAAEDSPEAHEKLMKAQDIVTELMNCLDLSFPVAENLFSLYEFILHGLQEANVKKDSDLLGELLAITEDLRGAWKEVSDNNRGTAYLSEDPA